MTPVIAYILGLFLVALVLFSTEVVAVDIIALIVLLALVLPAAFGVEILTPADALGSFGDESVILLISLFILTTGLVRTGVIADFGHRLYAAGAKRPKLLMNSIMGIVAFVSSWMSNMVTTAVFLPIVLGLTQKLKVSPSKLLMPLAFASILGGSCTLIGTSTNLVVSGRMSAYGMAPISLFELAPVGIPIVVLGMAYLFFVGMRLIPERHKGTELTEAYKMRAYLSELLVPVASELVGKTIREANIGERLDLTVLGIVRGEEQLLSPRPDLRIEAGDLLLAEGKVADIVRIKDLAGLEIKADVTLRDPDLTSANVQLAELLVMPGSWLAGRTLKEARFRERANLTVLAINHHGGVQRSKLSATTLRVGDVLVVQGTQSAIDRIAHETRSFMVLGDVSESLPRSGRGAYAAAIFAGVVVLGGAGLVSFPTAFILGVVLMFVTGCLTPEEGYRGVNWEMMVLVACMIAFGDAMEKTGTAKFVSEAIVSTLAPFGLYGVMTAFFLLTVLLTQPMSNQASALVVLPIAVETAGGIGVDPRTLVMTITFAASCSFLTPLEPSSIMVYGPGRYRFRDFIVVGSGLTLLVYAVVMVLVPVVWPPLP